MLVKIIIVIFLIAIMYSLASGLYYLARQRNKSDSIRVVKALTWRISLSLLLLVLLFIAYVFGLIKSHSV